MTDSGCVGMVVVMVLVSWDSTSHDCYKLTIGLSSDAKFHVGPL